MKVKLITWTNKPIETIYWAFMNMHNKVPDNLKEYNISRKEKKEFLNMVCSQPHQTVFEFVNTVWLFEGVSRAFQQQLTRTRQASYSIQSLRIVNVGKFAKNKNYTKSSKVENDTKVNLAYDKAMKNMQHYYNELIKLGCPVEDARGILPLNVHSTITMSINLRSLYHLLELRFCNNTQEEFREVARQMKKEIAEKISPLLARTLKSHCDDEKLCLSPVPCGKYQQKNKLEVSKWIKG